MDLRLSSRQPEEDHHRAVEAQDVLVIEMADPLPKAILGDSGDLIDHEP